MAAEVLEQFRRHPVRGDGAGVVAGGLRHLAGDQMGAESERRGVQRLRPGQGRRRPRLCLGDVAALQRDPRQEQLAHHRLAGQLRRREERQGRERQLARLERALLVVVDHRLIEIEDGHPGLVALAAEPILGLLEQFERLHLPALLAGGDGQEGDRLARLVRQPELLEGGQRRGGEPAALLAHVELEHDLGLVEVAQRLVVAIADPLRQQPCVAVQVERPVVLAT